MKKILGIAFITILCMMLIPSVTDAKHPPSAKLATSEHGVQTNEAHGETMKHTHHGHLMTIIFLDSMILS